LGQVAVRDLGVKERKNLSEQTRKLGILCKGPSVGWGWQVRMVEGTRVKKVLLGVSNNDGPTWEEEKGGRGSPSCVSRIGGTLSLKQLSSGGGQRKIIQ